MRKLLLACCAISAISAAAADAPRIDSITPGQGPISGGTQVTIRGAHFAGATVRLDGTPVTPAHHGSDEIRLVTPPRENGYLVISVTGPHGTAWGELLYLPPALSELEPGRITTIAGVGLHARDYGDAKQAILVPQAIAYGPDGALYVAEPGPNKVSRITAAGLIERVAGRGTASAAGGAGDGGPAIDAQISFPLAVAVDPRGNVYIPDHNYRIRKVDPATGIITTVAGTGEQGFSGDGGPAGAARIGLPTFAVADDRDLFFIDFDAMRIRRIHFADGTIATFAGNGVRGFSGDGGPATAASFDVGNSDLGALAMDADGNIYLSDAANQRIRRIDRNSGIITTVMGPVAQDDARFAGSIRAIAIRPDGNIFYSGSRIVEVTPAGVLVRAWSSGGRALADGTPIEEAYFRHVVGLAFDAAGDLVFADSFGRIFRFDPEGGTVSTVAGIAPGLIAEHGPPLAAPIGPGDLALDPRGLLFADTNRIRRIATDGGMVTVAGNGLLTFPHHGIPAVDVPAAPQSIDRGPDGSIDYTDFTAVHRIDPAGIVRLFAGRSPDCEYDGDGGPSPQAGLCQPWDSLRDAAGNVFIADTNNNRIRRVDAVSGIITTIAGNGGRRNGFEGYYQGELCGDGGPALEACLNTPFSLAIDSGGNLFIGDYGNRRIRRVSAAGTITTFAEEFATALRFDAFDRLYANIGYRIVRYDRDGTVAVLAGTADFGFGGDGGPATQAAINRGAGFSGGLVIDGEGNIIFSDPGDRRIRAIRFGAVLAPPGASIEASAAGEEIHVRMRDAAGRPGPGVRVELTAPPAGATCRFPDGSRTFAVVTGADGTAAATCARQCAGGSYAVIAKPAGSAASASVSRTDEAHDCRRRRSVRQ